jgi:hypothetical protein
LQTDILSIINSIVALAAFIISIIALIYTIKSFLLKSGDKIRCTFSTASSVDCDDDYIRSITLENLKDRAVVIFSIYMKIGENYFIELEKFDNSPLILKPFEAYHKEYDPIILYSVSTKRIKLNNLLRDRKIKKNLVLSTTNGKYEVNSNIKYWDPIGDFFKNHLTAHVRIQRLTYKGKGYGSNVKYLIEFVYENGEETIIPIRSGDERLKIFNNFQLTKESLQSHEDLRKFLIKQRKVGNITFSKIKVHDIQKTAENLFNDYDSHIIEAKYYGKVKYHLIGRFYTHIDNLRMKSENKKLKKNINNKK